MDTLNTCAAIGKDEVAKGVQLRYTVELQNRRVVVSRLDLRSEAYPQRKRFEVLVGIFVCLVLT